MTVNEEQCGWKGGWLNFFLWGEVWVVDTEGRRGPHDLPFAQPNWAVSGTSAAFVDRTVDPYQTCFGHRHQSPTSRAGSARGGGERAFGGRRSDTLPRVLTVWSPGRLGRLPFVPFRR